MRRRVAVFALFCIALLVVSAFANEPERIRAATEVFQEAMKMPDNSIPEELLEKSRCIVIIPSMIKGGFIVGGRYGRGVVSCRTSDNHWSAPSMVMIAGGSFGLQIGGQATDLILLMMNQRAMDMLFRDKVTLGGELSAAAGPVGRSASAETNAALRAEILSYSRSRGLFAGATIQGATLRPDKDGNRDVYGRSATARDILEGKVRPPQEAHDLLAALARHPAEGSRARR